MNRDEVLNRVEKCLAHLKHTLNNSPCLPLPLHHSLYTYDHYKHLYHKTSYIPITLSLASLGLIRRLLEMLIVIACNLKSRRTITKRSLYYQLQSLYPNYSQLDNDLDVLCGSLMVRRKQLGIVANAKTMLYGKLNLLIDGQLCTMNESVLYVPTALSIEIVDHLGDRIVLIVEKQSIFHTIKQHHLPKQYIVLSAKGYPDNLSRELLLSISWRVRAMYYLGDMDVFGLDIFLCYCFGNWEYEGLVSQLRLLCPSLDGDMWDGTLMKDVYPFTEADHKKGEQILGKEIFHGPAEYPLKHRIDSIKSRIQNFITRGQKIELEGLCAHALSQTWYLNLIQNQVYI